jgi:rhodanese-related sulfurtransferase
MIDQVQPAQLQDWMTSQAAHGSTIVLDVREAWEVETACVTAQGFELLKIPMHTIPPRIAELDRDQPIAVLCHHGGRSMQVAAFLERAGFKDVTNLTGGVHAWALQVDSSMPTY